MRESSESVTRTLLASWNFDPGSRKLQEKFLYGLQVKESRSWGFQRKFELLYSIWMGLLDDHESIKHIELNKPRFRLSSCWFSLEWVFRDILNAKSAPVRYCFPHNEFWYSINNFTRPVLANRSSLSLRFWCACILPMCSWWLHSLDYWGTRFFQLRGLKQVDDTQNSTHWNERLTTLSHESLFFIKHAPAHALRSEYRIWITTEHAFLDLVVFHTNS